MENNEANEGNKNSTLEYVKDGATELLKEFVNYSIEDPVNLFVKGYNYVTGSQLPILNITGIADRPPEPVRFIKAGLSDKE